MITEPPISRPSESPSIVTTGSSAAPLHVRLRDDCHLADAGQGQPARPRAAGARIPIPYDG